MLQYLTILLSPRYKCVVSLLIGWFHFEWSRVSTLDIFRSNCENLHGHLCSMQWCVTKTPFPTCKIFANHLLFVNYKRGILFVLLETPHLPSSTLICLRIVPSLMRFLLSCLKVKKFKDMCLDYSFYNHFTSLLEQIMRSLSAVTHTHVKGRNYFHTKVI